MNQFVEKRLRAKPVTYTVEISHFVTHEGWQMSLTVNDISMDEENKNRVASDLRRAADMIVETQEN